MLSQSLDQVVPAYLVLPSTLSLVSVAKLPSLDKEGKPRPQTAAGVVRTTGEKPHQQLDSSKSPPQWCCATAVAARHVPSLPEEGSFQQSSEFRDGNSLKSSDA